MGCNAWNHPPDCDCGWGGATHWGDFSPLTTVSTAMLSKPIPADGKLWRTSRSSNPNAYCPVCSQPVYFVETENGGRVFFDELGPPWPKHPCTDNDTNPVPLTICSCTTVVLEPSNDWFILSSPTVKSEDGVTIIEGHCKALGKYLRLRAEMDCNINVFPPIFAKPLGLTGAFELSYPYSILQEKYVATESRLFWLLVKSSG